MRGTSIRKTGEGIILEKAEPSSACVVRSAHTPATSPDGRGEKCKAAFTLAETLITLLVIGVVAALTIPALMQQIGDYTLQKQKDVFSKKFAEGLRQMRVDEKLAERYETTADFVKEMQKYFKISAICNKDNLKGCFTDTFTAKAFLDGEETAVKTIQTSEIRTTRSLVEKSSYDTEVIGITFSDGTKMLITYNTECTGPESGDTTGNLYSCFGYVVDVNGDKSPNISEKDIISNLPLIKNFGLSFDIIDNKVYSYNECDSDNICLNSVAGPYYSNDVLSGAQEFCKKKGGRLPSMDEFEDIMSIIYSNANCTKGTNHGYSRYYPCDRDKIISNSLFRILNSSQYQVLVLANDSVNNYSSWFALFAEDNYNTGTSSRNDVGSGDWTKIVLCIK